MELLKRAVSVFTAFTFMVYFAMGQTAPMICVQAKEEQKDYIVCTQSEPQVKSIENGHELSGEINGNGEDLLQENHMTSVQMTEREAEKISEDNDVTFVEEDILVKASAGQNTFSKKVKKIKKNESGHEWNARMIRSDRAKEFNKKSGKKEKGREKVKIAILDSGVDYGNDIDVAQTITLVPGEEEMSPLFMDGTGHGDSVAGLIAAKDDGEGITGVNPNAEIYSIRVLDDDNCAPVSRVVEAIYKAIDWKVNIINMSFGVSEYSAALEKAVKDADKAGILMIAAAGNTGRSGVQYPAAFDEVMAVGSVDQQGDVVESSAKGEEVEIVAPGELVRSTGFLGEQIVDSGTSLAAPQVAAVASLIWEKDLSMSADFVRALLKESANAYGEQEAYGNGLVDAEYALKNYKSFQKKYKEKAGKAALEENEEAVLSFEETGCVKGSWTVDTHAGMVPSTNKNVQKGARFPDKKDGYTINAPAKYYVFAGMKNNPWWHGFFRHGATPVNYVATYIYETRLANQMTAGGTVQIPNGLSKSFAKYIREDIGKIKWDKEFKGETVTAGKKRAFLWGMAIHNMTDAYSHSAYAFINNGWHYLNHDGDPNPYAHDTSTKYGNRFACAQTAVNYAMSDYKANRNGTDNVFFHAISNAKDFVMGDIKRFVSEAVGVEASYNYWTINYIPNYNVK